MRIVVWPGFMGLEREFDELSAQLKVSLCNNSNLASDPVNSVSWAFGGAFGKLSIEYLDIRKTCSEWCEQPISEVGQKLARYLLEQRKKTKNPCRNERDVFVAIGYSMGGRMLLETLKHEPRLFDALVFVSTHPGLVSREEKLERKGSDERWAQQFETQNWDELMKAWNSQATLAKSGSQNKTEPAIEIRKHYAQMLRNWSLSHQSNARETVLRELGRLNIPALWVTGEWDQKFTSLADSLDQGAALHRVVIPKSGHRVHLDQPARLATAIVTFLQKKTAETSSSAVLFSPTPPTS